MSTNYTREPNSIRMLMDKLNSGKLYLPEFQRDFTWNIERSVDLFDSIARGIFIGGLIESKPKFPLSCRQLDNRPRKGKGSRAKLNEYNFKTKDFENNNIFVLLDGQQRVTSLYRALYGVDDIYFILKEPENLPSPDTSPTDLMDLIDGFGYKELEDRICFAVNDIFSNDAPLDKVFKSQVFDPVWEKYEVQDKYQNLEDEYFVALLYTRNLFNKILDDKMLLSVFLLDMDLEKFCLFFERSNSRGVSLNFIDIITAKIYVGFSLRKEIEELENNLDIPIDKNIVESLVRYISFLENGKVDKKTILSSLDHDHFNKHWHQCADLFNKVYSYILSQNLVIQFSWLNYKTMLIPMAHFLRNLDHMDISQMSENQRKHFRYWFYSSLINTRYGGGMAGSTNDVIVDDCLLLEKLAKDGDLKKTDIAKFRVIIDKDSLLNLTSRGAFFNGIMCLMNYHQRFKQWSNIDFVNTNKKIDVHHVFPKKFIEKNYEVESFENENVDTILNKVVIEKLPNQKYAAKAPSKYLNEVPISLNEKIEESLKSHCLPSVQKLVDGEFDNNFQAFLDERYALIKNCLEEEIFSFQKEILG